MKEYLKHKNMSQNAFADKIMDICRVLKVTPEQLLTGKGIDEDYVEYKSKKGKAEPEISKISTSS